MDNMHTPINSFYAWGNHSNPCPWLQIESVLAPERSLELGVTLKPKYYLSIQSTSEVLSDVCC